MYNWSQNEAPRLPKPPQETFWTPKGPLRALRGWFWEALGALPGRSGALLGSSGGPCGVLGGGHLEHCWLIFVSPGGVRGEISEQLEFDDLLNENARFLKSQGLENEV